MPSRSGQTTQLGACPHSSVVAIAIAPLLQTNTGRGRGPGRQAPTSCHGAAEPTLGTARPRSDGSAEARNSRASSERVATSLAEPSCARGAVWYARRSSAARMCVTRRWNWPIRRRRRQPARQCCSRPPTPRGGGGRVQDRSQGGAVPPNSRVGSTTCLGSSRSPECRPTPTDTTSSSHARTSWSRRSRNVATARTLKRRRRHSAPEWPAMDCCLSNGGLRPQTRWASSSAPGDDIMRATWPSTWATFFARGDDSQRTDISRECLLAPGASTTNIGRSLRKQPDLRPVNLTNNSSRCIMNRAPCLNYTRQSTHLTTPTGGWPSQARTPSHQWRPIPEVEQSYEVWWSDGCNCSSSYADVGADSMENT